MKIAVIEGLDGAGKSTQIRLLAGYFEKNGVDFRYIHFPRTDTPYFGELIARFLRGEFGLADSVDPYLVAMLFAGDRKDAAAQIRTWLNEGKLVLLDRYTYSNIAYQCAKLMNPDDRARLRKWITELEFRHFEIPVPDINIFLDAPLRFTMGKLTATRKGDDRSYLNGSADIHEVDSDLQKRVRDMYLETAMTDKRLTVIKCYDDKGNMLSPAEIFSLIVALLKAGNILE